MPTPDEVKRMQQEQMKAMQQEIAKFRAANPHAQDEVPDQPEFLRKKLQAIKDENAKPDFILKAGKIEKATKESAAFDLFYNGDKPLVIGDKPVAVPTGVFTEFKAGFVCIIKEKSGLALKGIEIKGGVIDADYRDEWKVIARKPVQTSYQPKLPFVLQPGMAIAQFIIVALPRPVLSANQGAEICFRNEERKGGFGSTETKAE